MDFELPSFKGSFASVRALADQELIQCEELSFELQGGQIWYPFQRFYFDAP